jgi:Uma2 family endonuclease
MALPNSQEKCSYADYLTWDADQRWQLIEGKPYNMSPAPSRKHQEVVGNIFAEFHSYLRGKACKVYSAPFDVRLTTSDDDSETFNVVQPDITVVCDPGKLDKQGCKGTPDLIVEVISPASVKLDRLLKFNLYEKYRVKEYWIVDPENESVEVFRLVEGKYSEREVYSRDDDMKVGIFSDMTIQLNTIFDS